MCKRIAGCSRGKRKVLPILGRLIPHLKNALNYNNPDTFLEAMNVVEMLSDLVGENLNPYLHFFYRVLIKEVLI